jgi:Rap1a immunity proteins
MKQWIVRLVAAGSLLLPVTAMPLTQEDFLVKTTRDLLNLCSATADDPMQKEATHMCHGYLIGAVHYHEAAVSLGRKRLVCFPNPAPSRNEAVAEFVQWAKARPQHMNELPVETEFRFLMEKWPCK